MRFLGIVLLAAGLCACSASGRHARQPQEPPRLDDDTRSMLPYFPVPIDARHAAKPYPVRPGTADTAPEREQTP